MTKSGYVVASDVTIGWAVAMVITLCLTQMNTLGSFH
jgi:hypothetical protein